MPLEPRSADVRGRSGWQLLGVVGVPVRVLPSKQVVEDILQEDGAPSVTTIRMSRSLMMASSSPRRAPPHVAARCGARAAIFVLPYLRRPSCSTCTAFSPTCGGAGSPAELLDVLHELDVSDGRRARRAARGHPAHPADAGHRHGLRRRGRRALRPRTSRYEGPTGHPRVFQDACVTAGMPAIGFWAGVPHYVSQPPNPQATVALLQRRRGGPRTTGPPR